MAYYIRVKIAHKIVDIKFTIRKRKETHKPRKFKSQNNKLKCFRIFGCVNFLLLCNRLGQRTEMTVCGENSGSLCDVTQNDQKKMIMKLSVRKGHAPRRTLDISVSWRKQRVFFCCYQSKVSKNDINATRMITFHLWLGGAI